jgi:hypothetical protein
MVLLPPVHKPVKTPLSAFGKTFRSFASSTFLLVSAAFLIGYVCLFYGLQKFSDHTDLANLELPAWMVQFTPTVPKFLTSQSKPEILLMGSSLVLSPAALIEKSMNRTGYGCTYFEDELERRTGKHLTVDNVGVIAGMVCDQYAILKACLEAGRKPSFIIYGMAPRDFADNITSVENSPTQQVLAFCRSTNRFLPETLKAEDAELCLNTHKVTANRWLKSLRSASLQMACRLSKHPATLSETVATKSDKPVPAHTHQIVIAEDLEIYRQRYNPPNYERLKSQSAYLESLLELCAHNRIPILLVNMPLPDVNRNVIQPELITAYKNVVKKIADHYSCEFVDFDKNEAFAQNDTNFNDCVHLNANGGKKFFNMLSDYLAKDKTFATAYNIQRPAVAQTEKAAVF